MQKEKWWHLYHKSEENLGEASAASLYHCCIENLADVNIISSKNTGHWAVLKFEATPIAGCFTPGTFNNQFLAAFWEPYLSVVSDPRDDHQLLTEVSSVNLPTISLCNKDPLLSYVSIAILYNTRELTRWVWDSECWPGKFCTSMAPSPITMRGQAWSLLLQGRGWRGRAGHCWKGCTQGGTSVWMGYSSSQI